MTETLAGDFRLNGDLLDAASEHAADIITISETRRGWSAALVILYLEAARRAGLEAAAVDFPGHVLLRVETPDGPVALDPFSQGRLVLPSKLTRRALHAGLTPHVADRLDLLMAPISERQALLRSGLCEKSERCARLRGPDHGHRHPSGRYRQDPQRGLF